jgi:hypothetical protein
MKPGTGVEVEGLVARPDLNGMSATVLGYVPEKDRFHVKIVGSGEEVCLKPTSVAKIKTYPPGSCGNCGAAPVKPAGKLKNCAGCFAVAYCGSECNTAHWQRHKAACKARMEVSARINFKEAKEALDLGRPDGHVYCSVNWATMAADGPKMQPWSTEGESKKLFIVKVQIPVDLSLKFSPPRRAATSFASCMAEGRPAYSIAIMCYDKTRDVHINVPCSMTSVFDVLAIAVESQGVKLRGNKI